MSFQRIATPLDRQTLHIPPNLRFIQDFHIYIYATTAISIVVICALTCEIASRLAHIRNTTPPLSVGDSLNSKSLIVYATR